MHLTKAEIKNFRLLKDSFIAFDPKTTVVVGRNNTGKTSLTELFHRVLGENNPVFRLEDFSLSAHEEFWTAYNLFLGREGDDVIRAALPMIEIRLTVDYESGVADLGALSDFIIDLDPNSTQAIIHISYRLNDGKIATFFGDVPETPTLIEQTASRRRETVFRTIKNHVRGNFSGVVEAVDPNDETNRRLLEWSQLRALMQSGFINAARGLDDQTQRDRDVLAQILGALFHNAESDTAKPEDQETAKLLKAAVDQMQTDIGTEFAEQLSKLMPALEQFGYPGLTDPGLSTETTLEIDGLLAQTKVRYSGANGITLPEGYNGLGTRNLIYILLVLLQNYKDFQSRAVAAGMHLIFIEEPEAHLHPQMQEVFIKQLSTIGAIFERLSPGGHPWSVQFVVSTHSSHVANEASFDAIRYFIAKPDGGDSKACHTDIKDLSEGLSPMDGEDRKFLHQYMTLTRCDLFFADKAVLIEGTTERLLFWKMVEKLDGDHDIRSRLASQYISVIEVGGAYAHKLFKLLTFLELKTLIITDLDAIGPLTSTKACKVYEGTDTSNYCIKTWFGVPNITPADLISKSATDKTQDIGYLTYQVPESEAGPCGRSFEGAFMLANPELFPFHGSTSDELENDAWAATESIKKSEFALRYAIEEQNWIVPRYIKDGLIWLADAAVVSDPAVTSTVPVPAAAAAE